MKPSKTGVNSDAAEGNDSYFARVNLAINPVISHEWGKSREVLPTSGTLPWSFVTQIFHGHGGDHKTFEVMTSTYAIWILGSVGSLLAATLYQGNTERNHKLWDIVSTERHIFHIFCWNVATYKYEVRNGEIVIISFVLYRPSLSMSRCRSRYEADLVVYVIFFISINQQCSCVWEKLH
jgi:hypothetical protein